MDFNDIKQQFFDNCIKGFCQRKTFKSVQCKKLSKQNRCFDKYIKQMEIDSYKQIDEEWLIIQQKVKERDKTCLIEKILTLSEQIIIRERWIDIYYHTGSILDCAHILPRSQFPELVYDLNNIILIKRVYHTLLDQNINFFTGKFESGFREKMINRIMHTNRIWNDTYDYETYRKDRRGEISRKTTGN
jgi:hypothetical protein